MGQSTEQYGDRLFTHDNAEERARLDSLALAVSGFTYQALASLDVPTGRRLLDVGGGTGVVAEHLAAMHPGAETVCVDRSTALMRDGAGYTPLEADVCDLAVWDRLGTFGLVHSRNLLMHLRQRDVLFDRMVDAVAPGGWLVVADLVDAPDLMRSLAYRAVFAQFRRYMEGELGTSMTYGTGHAQRLHDAGLTSIGVSYNALVVGPGEHGAGFMARSLRHLWPDMVAKGYARAGGADEVIAYLEAGRDWDTAMGFVTAWGRKV
ncbi:class I SAM-dependent methyltransferase [Kitasatospora sp. NPDC088346]|uniref:class I SAM-dependent methyltransferase n=1 Tax=Kitasatospora sp. NPDC088346 TaxID=3364073 RepID=UPI0037F1DABF